MTALQSASVGDGAGIPPTDDPHLPLLEEIQQKVLWLAARMVDSANHDRETLDGVKVGGHQASSASLVTVMTALWFSHLGAHDRVSVKPHASPAFHAIQYLLGLLDRKYLTELRAYRGLQSYPSRTKDPDRVDFSTGSVGLGAVAPLFAAATRRYVDAHFGDRPHSRFIALIGDAELDEGNIWEAVADPATQGLGSVMWLVDFNRQSLDRVVPGQRIGQWTAQFKAAGWHVIEVKYGRLLEAAFNRPDGPYLREWIDAMPNEHYQSLFALAGKEFRDRFCENAPAPVTALCDRLDYRELRALVTDLGGHDLASLLAAFAECDRVQDRPSVVFAYTVKGWGLPIAGNPRNHSALLTDEQICAWRQTLGLSPETEWDRFDPMSTAGRLCAQRGSELTRGRSASRPALVVPDEIGRSGVKASSTQETFGRLLTGLSRLDDVGPYLVTTAPDVATSTNLAGFINRTGVFAPQTQQSWSPDAVLPWRESPEGQHIELGISEMNLFGLLGQLGLSWDLSDQPLLAIGTVYDPFILRGLDALIYAAYCGARFVVAGTPSGVTLAGEGGAHQSIGTPSVGLEIPNLTTCEPAYGKALDWMLCDALGRIGRGDTVAGDQQSPPTSPGAFYFRLTTRPLEQTPFVEAGQRLGTSALRRQVLAGAYRLVDAASGTGDGTSQACGQRAPVVQFAASGAVMPEVLAAASALGAEGVRAHVVDVTSLDRLYSTWQASTLRGIRTASAPDLPGIFRSAFDHGVPIVTVHDASSHAMAWLGSAVGAPAVCLGVDSFGQSGTVHDLYRIHHLDSDSLINAALSALTLDG